MTTFAEQMFADLGSVFFKNDEFAVSATFTGGSAVDVIVDHDTLIQTDGYEVGVATIGTTITALFSDVGTPVRGNTFVIGSTTYTVQRIEENDKKVVKMVVK